MGGGEETSICTWLVLVLAVSLAGRDLLPPLLEADVVVVVVVVVLAVVGRRNRLEP